MKAHEQDALAAIKERVAFHRERGAAGVIFKDRWPSEVYFRLAAKLRAEGFNAKHRLPHGGKRACLIVTFLEKEKRK